MQVHAFRIFRTGRIGLPAMVALVCQVGVATAAEPPRPSADVPVSRVSSQPECTCRAGGQNYGVGTQICIGNRMMRCSMAINVTSWEQTGEPCPLS